MNKFTQPVAAIAAPLLVFWVLTVFAVAMTNTSDAAERCTQQQKPHYWVSNPWLVGLTGECIKEITDNE